MIYCIIYTLCLSDFSSVHINFAIYNIPKNFKKGVENGKKGITFLKPGGGGGRKKSFVD